MEPLIIWGASGHARVVADAVRQQQAFRVVGFIDDNPARKGAVFEASRIVGGRDVLAALFEDGVRFVHIAIGHCGARLSLGEFAVTAGFQLATVVHPRATVAPEAMLGEGCFVAAGAVVNSGARVGRSVIVNTSASIDHDCVLEDGVHVGPGCHLGGASRVGSRVWLGIGAVLIDQVEVGAESIIGAGGLVVKDIPAGVVAYGVPAKVVRAKLPDE